jgi:hypothetical protein
MRRSKNGGTSTAGTALSLWRLLKIGSTNVSKRTAVLGGECGFGATARRLLQFLVSTRGPPGLPVENGVVSVIISAQILRNGAPLK